MLRVRCNFTHINRVQQSAKRRHTDVNQGPRQRIRDSHEPSHSTNVDTYKKKYEFWKGKYTESRSRYEVLFRDAKNRESAFIGELKAKEKFIEELKTKEKYQRDETNFFDNSMDELKKRHEQEIQRMSETLVR